MHKIPMPNKGSDMAELLKANGFIVELAPAGTTGQLTLNNQINQRSGLRPHPLITAGLEIP